MNSSPASILFNALAGEWVGTGRGDYPTIDPFEYADSIRFVIDEGRFRMFYEQRSAHHPVGVTEPTGLHWEAGFLRVMADGQIEASNTTATGRVEAMQGSFEPTPTGIVLHLHSTHLGNDPRVVATHRIFTVDGDTLHFSLDMHTMKTKQLTFHAKSTLARK